MKRNYIFTSLLVAVLLFSTGYGEGQRSTPVHQAWDYKNLGYYSGGPGSVSYFEDDKNLQPSGNTSGMLFARLKQLGNEGWELVAVTSTQYASQGSTTYYLKRPK
jgi:hypothetical protein